LKQSRVKKVLGIALGERSLLAAEVLAAEGRPQVRRLAEMIYPEGISLSQPAELAKALSHFLKDNEFSTHAAVIGIPLKWLVVKAKEVPPADDATVAQLLRLEAESEFSTELKDLVYDFAGEPAQSGAVRTVLLAATPKKYLDAIETLCDGSRLQSLAVMPSALALGSITGSTLKRDVLVLASGESASELSFQRQATATSVRNLRPSTPNPPFVSELRRAVSTLGAANGHSEMILWDSAGLNATDLQEQIGMSVRSGDMDTLGVDSAGAGINGQGPKFASAVALALSVMDEGSTRIDFLHSRLAPPKKHRIPRWGYFAGAAAVLLIAFGVYAYVSLSQQEQVVDAIQANINSQAGKVADAKQFVGKATLAQYWHNTDLRYLECMRDLDSVIPEDGQTYATSLEIKAEPPPLNTSGSQNADAPVSSADEHQSLYVTLQGHTGATESVTALEDRMRRNSAAFKNIRIGAEAKVPRSNEYVFSIAFTYEPPTPTPAAGNK
jgi:hypothetical protein